MPEPAPRPRPRNRLTPVATALNLAGAALALWTLLGPIGRASRESLPGHVTLMLLLAVAVPLLMPLLHGHARSAQVRPLVATAALVGWFVLWLLPPLLAAALTVPLVHQVLVVGSVLVGSVWAASTVGHLLSLTPPSGAPAREVLVAMGLLLVASYAGTILLARLKEPLAADALVSVGGVPGELIIHQGNAAAVLVVGATVALLVLLVLLVLFVVRAARAARAAREQSSTAVR